MNKIISNTLKELKVTPAVIGYDYLRCAIKLTMEKPKIVHTLTKELYPAVARQFGTTSTRVERAMRHAIELAWSDYITPAQERIFRATVKSDQGKPTNGMFIATVADYLLINTMGEDNSGSK